MVDGNTIVKVEGESQAGLGAGIQPLAGRQSWRDTPLTCLVRCRRPGPASFRRAASPQCLR